jgi:UDP-N-acetylglucosamine--N-acetylmuramyl-(pentapeptide) pyrophosphoryl-undecaprenol N-acetylglucosamine transferase
VNIVIAGGGTAGHVNPALAVARRLLDARITFVGTSRGAEARLVPESGFRLERIEISGWDRARPLSLPVAGARAAGAVWSVRKILYRTRADVVLGMGGYVGFPACVAARMLGIPVVVHEQNIVFGLANRATKPLARAVAVSFRETLRSAGRRGEFTGNPVLPEIVDADTEAERSAGLRRWRLDPARKTLLVFGGSQGASTLNRAAIELASLWGERADLQIVHITGVAEHKAPVTSDLVYRSIPYVSRMIEAYAVADLALCRGGATTVAELTVTGVPSIVVPYPHHRDRQQELHGRALEAAGAARVVLDHEATGSRIAAVAMPLLEDGAQLQSMRTRALAYGHPDAADRVADLVTRVAA